MQLMLSEKAIVSISLKVPLVPHKALAAGGECSTGHLRSIQRTSTRYAPLYNQFITWSELF